MDQPVGERSDEAEIAGDLAIERATAVDLPAIIDVDRSVIGDARRQDYLARHLAVGQCVVARRGPAVVGFAVADTSFYEHGFLGLLIVHPHHRRRGIGSALIGFVEKHCPTVRLFTSTNLSNATMHQFCRSLGYQPSGYVDNLDPGDPEIIYSKRLR